MLLRDWLAAEALTPAQFAPRIGRTGEAVRRYAAGERIPDRETMPLIVRETEGIVTANDFFGIDSPPPEPTPPFLNPPLGTVQRNPEAPEPTEADLRKVKPQSHLRTSNGSPATSSARSKRSGDRLEATAPSQEAA